MIDSPSFARRQTLVTLLVAMIIFACVPACEEPALSPVQRQQLIGELRAARRLDEQNTRDPEADLTEASDSALQANRAGWAINVLEHGGQLSPSDLRAVLDVPPPRLSTDAKDELIRELQRAELKDQLKEQTYDPTNDWLAWDTCRRKHDLAETALDELRGGEPVPWTEIQEALRDPGDE